MHTHKIAWRGHLPGQMLLKKPIWYEASSERNSKGTSAALTCWSQERRALFVHQCCSPAGGPTAAGLQRDCAAANAAAASADHCCHACAWAGHPGQSFAPVAPPPAAGPACTNSERKQLETQYIFVLDEQSHTPAAPPPAAGPVCPTHWGVQLETWFDK